MNLDDSISFIRKESIKPKVIGHNKFQIQLKELNTKLKTTQQDFDISQQLNKNLQDEILFLKKQQNLHQDIHSTLHNDFISVNKEFDNLKQKYIDLDKSTKITIADFDNVNKKFFIENLELTNTISQISLEKDSINSKYNEIKIQYKTLLSNFNIKSNENTNLTNLLNETSTMCSLYKDTNLKLQTDLDSINLEINKIQNHNYTIQSQLQSQLQLKDNIIGILHFKYGKEYKIDITPEINNIDITPEINNIDITTTINSKKNTMIIPTKNIQPIKTIEKVLKGIKISSK